MVWAAEPLLYTTLDRLTCLFLSRRSLLDSNHARIAPRPIVVCGCLGGHGSRVLVCLLATCKITRCSSSPAYVVCERGCSARQRLMTRDPSTQVKRWSSSTTPPTAPLGVPITIGSRAIHASTTGIESRARAISLPRCTYSRASRPRTLAGARDIDRRHVVPARWAAIISKEPSHRPSASSAA